MPDPLSATAHPQSDPILVGLLRRDADAVVQVHTDLARISSELSDLCEEYSDLDGAMV